MPLLLCGQTSSVHATSSSAPSKPAVRDEGLWEEHSWDVSPQAAAASRQSSKAEEAQRQVDAAARKADQARAKEVSDARERERRDVERRERELKDREEKLKQKERMLEARGKNGGVSVASGGGSKKKEVAKGPKRPPFNFEKVRFPPRV